jgi:ABC-type phosphate/phosphonate transport system substrate-binding protein
MGLLQHASRQATCRAMTIGFCALAPWLATCLAASRAEEAELKVLRIGSSGRLTAEGAGKEKANLESLRSFIKDETGLNNEIIRQKGWSELADKIAKGQLELGVFQGYEFAWAQSRHARLKPLALAVNVYRYPVAYVVVRADNPAKDFSSLAGKGISLPDTGKRYLRVFVEHKCQALGKTRESFFSKVTAPDNFEDALDDVVDNKVQAAVADRAALEAYKQRKPGRFKRLKHVAHSEPLPPIVVAYYDNVVDEPTRERFRDGLLNAANKEKGQQMLTLFRLTGFESVPADFERIVARTRKTYPPPDTTREYAKQ